ncbi:MAG: preprotein translocase subunit YajC [Nostocoides sp.]
MPAGSGNLLILALPILLLGFMMWSQRKRQRQTQNLQSAIAVGDHVVTTSGLYGTVKELEDSTVKLEVSPNVVVTYDRRAIGSKAA